MKFHISEYCLLNVLPGIVNCSLFSGTIITHFSQYLGARLKCRISGLPELESGVSYILYT